MSSGNTGRSVSGYHVAVFMQNVAQIGKKYENDRSAKKEDGEVEAFAFVLQLPHNCASPQIIFYIFRFHKIRRSLICVFTR